MENKDFSKVILNEDEMLITEAKDYNEDSKSFKPAENVTYEVGVIHHVGKSLPKEYVGGTVMFHMNLSTPVEIKGFGKFNVLKDSSKLVVLLN